MTVSLRSHLIVGTAALIGTTTIAMTPVTRPDLTSVAFQVGPPITQTIDVALAALQHPTAAALGPGDSCSPVPFCNIQIGISDGLYNFVTKVLNPILEFLVPGVTTSIGGFFLAPIALLLAPILVPIRLIQNLVKPAKPAASRGVNSAAALAAPEVSAAPAPVATPAVASGLGSKSKSSVASKRSTSAATAANAAAVVAPRAAAVAAAGDAPKAATKAGVSRRAARTDAADVNTAPNAAAARHR